MLTKGAPPLCKCGCGAPVEWFRKKARWRVYVIGHYRSNASYKSREWLLENYGRKRMTMDEIAAVFGVSGTTILKAMKRHGVQRRSISESRIGRHLGSANTSWKGGVTPERQRLYKTPGWKQLVKDCFARDGYHCVRCNAPKTRRAGLHSHHVQMWADTPGRRSDLTNLVTLCDVCHVWVHSKQNVLRDFLI